MDVMQNSVTFFFNPKGGQGQRVVISSFCLPLLIETFGSRTPGMPPCVPSPILFTNNDSYGQTSALHILHFIFTVFK